VLLMMIDDPVD